MEIVLERYPPIYKIGVDVPVLGKRYRSSFEIIALILEAACEGVSRFAIARHMNTNYFQLRRYLAYLVKIGFIDVESYGKKFLYKTSKRGLEFLRLYYAILKMLSSVDEAPVKIVCRSVRQKGTVKGRGRRNFGL